MEPLSSFWIAHFQFMEITLIFFPLHLCVCVWYIFTCRWAHVYVCLHVCVYIYTRRHMCVCASTYTCVHIYMHVGICMCVLVYVLCACV